MSRGGGTIAAAGRQRAATWLLVLACLASGTLIVVLASRLSFILDDWVFILFRRGSDLDAFMRPDNEHLVAGAVLVWKALIAIFGIGSTAPYRVVSTAMFLAGCVLAFVWLRRRVGAWPALLATVLVLFMGAAFDDVLWFSSITFLGSMGFGMAALVALDRRDRLGDRLACGFLVGSLLFSSLWIAFAIGAAVDLALRRDERPWRSRAYLLAVPLVLYALWWIGWGHESESALSISNLGATPLYVLDSIAAGLAALLGLAIPAPLVSAPNGLDWGQPLAVFLIALAAWRLTKMRRIPTSFWVVLAIGLSFWILGGLAVKPGRTADASRYQYPGAVFILLIAATLLQGVRFPKRLLAPALVVTAAAVLANVAFLHEAYRSYLSTGHLERADLAALEITRDSVEPGLVLGEEIAGTGDVAVDAGSYLSARDAYGSPAFDEAQLAAAEPAPREAADRVMAAALRLSLSPLEARPTPAARAPVPVPPTTAGAAGRGCIAVDASGPAVVRMPPGGAALRAEGGGVAVGLERFSESFPVALGTLPEGRWTALAIPQDRSHRPWRAQLSGAGTVTLCSEASDVG